MKTLILVASLFVASFSLAAQTQVMPPPKPASVMATANAEIITLLQAGMPESIVLDKIHATTDKFDTSAASLVALKKTGATEAELKAILAHERAPQPANQPAADQQTSMQSPSLEETMKFIEDQINAKNNIYFDKNSHEDGVSVYKNLHYTYSIYHTNPALCYFNYHMKAMIGDTTVSHTAFQDNDFAINLKDIREVSVKPYTEFINEYQARNGYPAVLFDSVVPPMTAVAIPSHVPEPFYFLFADPAQADQVARAFNHAVELCGSGKKDPF
jgi:hypothetical protein